jgi:hypothetical protein
VGERAEAAARRRRRPRSRGDRTGKEARGQAGTGKPLGRRRNEGKSPSEEQKPPHERGSAGTSYCARTAAGRGPAADVAAPSPSDGAAPRLLLLHLRASPRPMSRFFAHGGRRRRGAVGTVEGAQGRQGARLETHGTGEGSEGEEARGCGGRRGLRRWSGDAAM